MQIQLKQTEIIKGINMYIESQGINLSCKDVEMSFTAGRKDTGLSVEVSITESENTAPVARLAKVPAVSETVEAAEEVTEWVPTEEEEEVPVKGASLFG